MIVTDEVALTNVLLITEYVECAKNIKAISGDDVANNGCTQWGQSNNTKSYCISSKDNQ